MVSSASTRIDMEGPRVDISDSPEETFRPQRNRRLVVPFSPEPTLGKRKFASQEPADHDEPEDIEAMSDHSEYADVNSCGNSRRISKPSTAKAQPLTPAAANTNTVASKDNGDPKKLPQTRLKAQVIYERWNKLKDEHRELNQQFATFKAQKKVEITKLTRESREASKEHDEETAELRKRIAELEQNLEEKARKLKKLAEAHLMQSKKEIFQVEPDSQAASILKGNSTSINSWTAQYTIKAWTYQSLSKVLEAFVRISDVGDRPFVSKKFEMAVARGIIPPRVIGNAFLHHQLYAATLNRPFAQLSNDLDDAGNERLEGALTSIMSFAKHSKLSRFVQQESPLIELDSRQAQHRLRANILRAIEQPSEPRSQASQQMLQPRHKQHCERAVADFIEDFSMMLRNDLNYSQRQKRATDLQGIFEDMMKLSIVFAAQHPFINIRFLNDLDESSFDMRDREFRPARGLHLEVDDDDDDKQDINEAARACGIYGKPLDLVISPCITRHGDKDAEHYDMKTVLCPGTVWMVKDKDLTAGTPLFGGKSSQHQTQDQSASRGTTSSLHHHKRGPIGNLATKPLADIQDHRHSNVATQQSTIHDESTRRITKKIDAPADFGSPGAGSHPTPSISAEDVATVKAPTKSKSISSRQVSIKDVDENAASRSIEDGSTGQLDVGNTGPLPVGNTKQNAQSSQDELKNSGCHHATGKRAAESKDTVPEPKKKKQVNYPTWKALLHRVCTNSNAVAENRWWNRTRQQRRRRAKHNLQKSKHEEPQTGTTKNTKHVPEQVRVPNSKSSRNSNKDPNPE
jgi:hypothetical protein